MKAGDILWIVGDKLRITAIKKAEEEYANTNREAGLEDLSLKEMNEGYTNT
jgi:hypothetical protein